MEIDGDELAGGASSCLAGVVRSRWRLFRNCNPQEKRVGEEIFVFGVDEEVPGAKRNGIEATKSIGSRIEFHHQSARPVLAQIRHRSTAQRDATVEDRSQKVDKSLFPKGFTALFCFCDTIKKGENLDERYLFPL
jgi:hypothetical protein